MWVLGKSDRPTYFLLPLLLLTDPLKRFIISLLIYKAAVVCIPFRSVIILLIVNLGMVMHLNAAVVVTCGAFVAIETHILSSKNTHLTT